MPKLQVIISTTADGSMYNRNDHLDAVVYANREALLAQLDVDASQTTRVKVNYDRDSFTHIWQLVPTDKGRGMLNEDVEVSDAIVTTEPNHALFLPIADCVGASIYDPEHHALMVAHWGRHSLEQQGAVKCIQFFKDTYGSDASKLQVQLTPAPAKEHYPIWKLDNKGMKEATFEQLAVAGIARSQVTDNDADTVTDDRYYSYHAFLKGDNKKDGDYAIVAVMKP